MVGIEKNLASGKLAKFSMVKQASFKDVSERVNSHKWIPRPPRPKLLGSSLSQKGFGGVSRPQVLSVIRDRIRNPHVAFD
jgi:hypothetical protein